MNLGSTEMMYLQERKGGEGLGYPGLDRCPSCLSKTHPPQDTGQEPKVSIIITVRESVISIPPQPYSSD